MWSSYHIYTEDRNYFLDKVSDILKEYPDVKFFFIQYIDPIGFHFRFRIQSRFQSKIEKMIYKLFEEQRVLKKIYDPEYNLFGSSLGIYEEFSIELSRFIIENKNIDSSTFVLPLSKNILQIFNCLNSEFIDTYINYWAKTVKRFNREDLNTQINFSKNDEKNQSHDLSIVLKPLSILEEKYVNESICIKFLHMALNKLGYTLMDEMLIVKKIKQSILV